MFIQSDFSKHTWEMGDLPKLNMVENRDSENFAKQINLGDRIYGDQFLKFLGKEEIEI